MPSEPASSPRRADAAGRSSPPSPPPPPRSSAPAACTSPGPNRSLPRETTASSPPARPPWSRPPPRRIAPGPHDDPAEKGHPGAREAGVTGYIDTMLGRPRTDDPPPMIFAGGPWSNRHTSGPDLMARFAALDPVAKIAWRKRLTSMAEPVPRGHRGPGQAGRRRLHQGQPRKSRTRSWPPRPVSTFTAPAVRAHHRGPVRRPRVRRQPRPGPGWQEIGFPGDIQPRGYTSGRGGALRRPRPRSSRAPRSSPTWSSSSAWSRNHMTKAIVIGSGACGSFAAMVLAQAGWQVTMFEKGPNHFSNLAGPGPDRHGVRQRQPGHDRALTSPGPDPEVFPRTWRPNEDVLRPVHRQRRRAAPGRRRRHRALGRQGARGSGTSTSSSGPRSARSRAPTWPTGRSATHEIAPFYDEVEQLIGVQGDIGGPPRPRDKSTRPGPGPVPDAARARRCARRWPSPPERQTPSACTRSRSRWRPTRPAVTTASTPATTAGSAASFGCPVVARPSALIPLRQALRTGQVQLVPETMVTKVLLAPRARPARRPG